MRGDVGLGKRVSKLATGIVVAVASMLGACGGSEAAPDTAATPVIAKPNVPGMRLLSRGLPAFASSGAAAAANDGDYNSWWRSSRVPAELAYDLSSIAASRRQTIVLAWYNDVTYGYDHALIQQVGYNNPGNYTIEANAGSGGGSPPGSGWIVLATVTGNTRHSREHMLDFRGYNWIRINATAADGTAGNMDILLNMDIYDASGGEPDSWLFAGDSITANGMGHANFASTSSESFGNQVGALSGIAPAQENAGMPNWTAAILLQNLPDWLRSFPGRYVTISVGTNDAAGGIAAGDFYTSMSALVAAVLATGKIPIVPSIPWSREQTHAKNIPGLNAQIRNLYQAFPKVMPGPDLYRYFSEHQELISADNVHPTDSGYAALRTQWATFAAQSVYKPAVGASH